MKQSPDNKLPKIKILGIEKDESGELNVEFEVCDEFLDYAQFELGVDTLSQEQLGEYVQSLIKKSINKEDGFEIKQNFTENSKTNIDN
jgi:hypothetical protein